jgi:uncharacterized UBP type Zn finger protein
VGICYANVVIQVLSHLLTPLQLKSALGDRFHERILTELHSLMVDMRCLDLPPSAQPLVNKVWNFGHKKYISGSQEDSNEFLVLLLNALSISSFQVTQREYVQCLTCKHDMYKNEDKKSRDSRLTTTGNVINLEMQYSSQPQSLNELLQRHFAPEAVDFTCYYDAPGGCASQKSKPKKKSSKSKKKGKKGQAIKEVSLLTVSDFTIITLKRYQVEQCAKKITSSVYFPLHLDLPIYSNQNSSQKFIKKTLVGIICHDGLSLSRGHYIAYVFNPYTSSWFKYDDEHVEPCSVFTVVGQTKDVYILFYGPYRPPGNFFNKKKYSNTKITINTILNRPTIPI